MTTDRRIKVMFAIGTLDLGGAERQLVELASGLDRTRFDPSVCVLAGEGPLALTLRERNVPVHLLGFIGFRTGYRIHILSTLRALFRMWRLMRRERPVIFHGVLFWAYMIGTVVARAARVPVVVASRRSLGLFKADKRLHLLFERCINRMTDLFIANSEAVRQDVMAQEGVPAGKILVIYNGLEAGRYGVGRNAELADELRLGDGPRVAVVSNFLEYKGYSYFFEAWERVVAENPSAVALLAGDGPARSHWERRALEGGFAETLRFLGSRSDVGRVLSLADMFVHPSLQEGYSNAILEAMASGLPVIATSVGGNVEAVRHEENGLLVPPRDAAALARAMQRLIREPELGPRLGRAGRELVEARFRLTDMVRQYEKVYERLAPLAVGSSGSEVCVG